MPPKANQRSSAVKRILQEHKELLADPSPDFHAAPLEDDLFEWHVTIRGSPGTDYAGGIYHLRISLPPTYPLSPPDIAVLTPQGRFQPGHKLCIDGLTSFHSGSWMPAWGIRTAVVGLMSFWNQLGDAVVGVGYLQYAKEEKRRLAGVSPEWRCEACQASNAEIMREHEEMIAAMPPAKGQSNGAEASSGHKGKQKEVVEANATEEVKLEASEDKQTEPVQPTAPAAPAATPAPASTPPSFRPPQLAVTPPTPLPAARPAAAAPAAPPLAPHIHVPPRPRGLLATLLVPPPAALAPLRVLHYYTLYLLLPPHMHVLLPPAPDRVAFLDCAIWAVGACLVLLAMDHWAVPRLEAAGVIGLGAAGVAGGRAVAGQGQQGRHAQPAAVTGVRRPELDRPGQLELQVDGTTLGGAPAPGGRVAVANGQEGAYRHEPAA